MKLPSSMPSLGDKRTLGILGLIVAAIFFLALNSVSNALFRGVGVDFTENSVYTLSQGTRSAIRDLDEPITLRLFISPQLTEQFPQYNAYATRVRSLIRRYVEISDGKIRLEIYEPEPFSEAEDLAASYGLNGIPINQSGQQAYFGLAGSNSIDRRETIPFFSIDREDNIEQDLTRLVVSLGPARDRVVGVITALPMTGQFQMGQGFTPPWPIMQQIDSMFRVRNLPTDTDNIPEEVDVLFIAHPRELEEATLYAIDQFVMRGGRVLAMIDPLPELAPRRRSMIGMSPVAPGSELPRLPESWGVRLRPGKVAADRNLALTVNTGRQGRQRIAPYIIWLDLKQEQMTESPLLGGIERIIMPSPGIIDRLESATTEVQPLLVTTRNSMAVDRAQVRRQPDFEGLIRGFEASNNVFPVAVRITGDISSAFEEPPAMDEDEGSENEETDATDATEDRDEAQNGEQDAQESEDGGGHLAESQRPADIILVADADMLHEQFWRNQQQVGGQEVTSSYTGNADFVLNALDSLSGANYMLGLRGKGEARRPFERVEAMQQAARERLEQTRLQLMQELRDTQERLRAARTQTEDGQIELTEEQRQEIDRFQARLFEIRRELRRVQYQLLEDVEALDARLKFINIGAIPILIGFIAIGLGIYRYRRRRRRYETG